MHQVMETGTLPGHSVSSLINSLVLLRLPPHLYTPLSKSGSTTALLPIPSIWSYIWLVDLPRLHPNTQLCSCFEFYVLFEDPPLASSLSEYKFASLIWRCQLWSLAPAYLFDSQCRGLKTVAPSILLGLGCCWFHLLAPLSHLLSGWSTIWKGITRSNACFIECSLALSVIA